MEPGRSCPLHYRYPPTVFHRGADVVAETIYVIGGLYGNRAALTEILQMASREAIKPTLVFNGDFNWFNVSGEDFSALNTEVLKHIALRGNVETELAGTDDAGCGCAYPEYVGDADVERSNEIMRRLRKTAGAFPALVSSLTSLPMHLVVQIGADNDKHDKHDNHDKRFGIVHGDAESLAGWRFAHDSLHQPDNVVWLNWICDEANLVGFASSHTCLPTFRKFNSASQTHVVINNGAAGMPNFAATQYGLISRLSIHAAPAQMSQYGAVVNGVHIDAIPVHFDVLDFEQQFLRDWPDDSPAHQSYFQRITSGPGYAPPHALGLVRAPSVCA